MVKNKEPIWMVGVTTVPSRVDTLLPATLRSLVNAGFPPAHLFVDGAADVTTLEADYASIDLRHPPLGHLGNWISTIWGLYLRNSHADYYAVFEDDLEAVPNIREYIERVGIPEKGYLNLLTHDENLFLAGGKRGWYKSNQKGRGAVGLVFTRKTVLDLFSREEFTQRPTLKRKRCADGMVMDSLKEIDYDEYVHYPSLLQHVGIESSLNHSYGKMLGYIEGFDPLTLLEGQETYRMTENDALSMMVPPGRRRPGIWRGGIIQIHITRACDLACFGCTQGSNLGGKPVMISLDDFEKACQSLRGYWGVVGIFGGNPAIHPKFDEICRILSLYFPKEQRGLWCNNPLGKGEVMRRTFNPAVSNLNVHGKIEAFEEFKRDWPESRPFGEKGDSRHSPPFVAMKDVIEDEAKRWELIANCDINRFWSAMVCSIPGRGLRAFFCELAGAQAMLHANDPTWPDTGLPAEEGWWEKPMTDFAEQARFHCNRCGIPLKRFGQLSQGGEYEEVSETHAGIYKPKAAGRRVDLVQIDEGPRVGLVTDYVGNGRLQPK